MISGLGARRPFTTQTLVFTTSSATVTNPFGAQTYVVRVAHGNARNDRVAGFLDGNLHCSPGHRLAEAPMPINHGGG